MDTVKSADGTVIAYDWAGAGPALIVSLGALADQAAAIPAARLQMLDGYGHNAPPEVLTPILTEFFGTCR